MSEIIREAKKIITEQYKGGWIHNPRGVHTEFSRAYFTTNENIDGYLSLFDISNKESALCVTASGDQLFNLITKGIYNIDTFDVNKISEYIVFGLKKAMILKYDYEEYLSVLKKLSSKGDVYDNLFSNIVDEKRTLIFDLLPYMDKKYRTFWKKIIDIDRRARRKYNNCLSIFSLFCYKIRNVNIIQANNSYLKNREEYNKLKEGLQKANITFKYANACNLTQEFNNKSYDLVLLSNILDYFDKVWDYGWKYDELQNYIDSLEKIVNNDGLIFLNYLFSVEYYLGAHSFDKDSNNDKINTQSYNFQVFKESNVQSTDLIDEEVYLLNCPEKEINDGIVLKRVKK